MEDLPSHGVKIMRVWCGHWPLTCGHYATIPLAQIDLRQTIVQFSARLRCTKCGKLGGSAQPAWGEPPDGTKRNAWGGAHGNRD
jgi:hypothetical protein